jgi:hypothetical protein
MPKPQKVIPIFTTSGDVGAFLLYPYIYSASGEWIGWVNFDRLVYSVHGHYVGTLSNDPRILRRRESDEVRARQTPPSMPKPIHPPSVLPLPPQLPELTMGMIDVLEEAPHLLPPVDFGELRDDMD